MNQSTKTTPKTTTPPSGVGNTQNQNPEYFDWRNLPDHYDPSLEPSSGLPLDMR